MSAPDRTARRFFLALMLVAIALLGAVILPIASALFIAAVLAGVLWPLQQRLSARLRGRRGLAAGILTFAVVVLVIGPLLGFSTFAIKEGTKGVEFVIETVRSEGVVGLVDRLPPPIDRGAHALIELLPKETGADLNAAGEASAAIGRVVKATGRLLFQLVMMLIALYFLLVDGAAFVAWLDAASPLGPGQTRELLDGFKRVAYAVIVSTVVTSGVQAVAALIGYLIAQVPHPFFFTGVTFFSAFVPAAGAAAICVLAAVVLFVTGHPYMAIFLGAWGLVVVGLVDNVVKPLLIRRGMELRGAIVFFALIGGLAAFGGVGLLLGPLIVALFLALVRMYQRDYAPSALVSPQR